MRIHSFAILSVAFFIQFATPSDARFVRQVLIDVPIERLIKNLIYQQKQCANNKCRADIEYRLARLHSMRYALGTKTVEIDQKDEASTAVTEPVLRDYESAKWPDYRQYEVHTGPLDDVSKKDLLDAVSGYRASLELEPNDTKALLGLGWCLEKQGNKAESISALRKAVSVAKSEFRNEDVTRTAYGFSNNERLAQEAASYLIPLLDRKRDAHEIKELSAMGKPDYVPHFVTPIVVATASDASVETMMSSCEVTFDIDGFGPQKLHSWPARNTGWLVWDPHGRGEIRSGVRLFGSSTFWIPWSNGYEALSALDDNHDGQLAGRELDGLALWVDVNSNGIAEPGEVQALVHHKIAAIVCKSQQVGGVLVNVDGVKFLSGKTASTIDWIYKIEPEAVARLVKR